MVKHQAATNSISELPLGAHGHEIFEIAGSYRGAGHPIADGSVVDWLLDKGRLVERDAEFFDELCWRLLGAGIPLWRANISVRTLHPQILGLGFRWWRN